MANKPYMPLMMGDWIRGTQGMRAEVKGVYIGLLIHQYDHGFLPSDLETLSLIEPEVGKVWVILKCKFEEFEPGKLRNKKLEEVRNFWNKQGLNGKKGGRPKKEKPKLNPNNNPETNPNNNLHNDIDHDIELLNNKEWEEKIFNDELYINQLTLTHKGKDLRQAWLECYMHHSVTEKPPEELWEWRQKLNTWLTIKSKDNVNRIDNKRTLGQNSPASYDGEDYRAGIR